MNDLFERAAAVDAVQLGTEAPAGVGYQCRSFIAKLEGLERNVKL